METIHITTSNLSLDLMAMEPDAFPTEPELDAFLKSVWSGVPDIAYKDALSLPEFHPIEPGMPLRLRSTPFKEKLISQDVVTGQLQTPLLLLAYALNTVMCYCINHKINWTRSFESKEDFHLPRNVHMSMGIGADLGNGIKERHNHHIPEHATFAYFVYKYLMLRDLKDPDGTRYAIHPYFSMPPSELLSLMQATDSPLTFVKDFLQTCLNNVDREEILWYPLHESYYFDASGMKYPMEMTPWSSFALSSELSCGRCGKRLLFSDVSFSADKVVHIQMNSFSHAIANESPNLPLCDVSLPLSAGAVGEVYLPTGKVLYADWLRVPRFTAALERNNQYDTSKWYSLNYPLGTIQVALHACTLDVIHGPTGNESVELYQIGPDIIITGHVSENDDDFDQDLSVADASDTLVGEVLLIKLGSICTDLWAYTLVDEQVFESLIQTSNPLSTKHGANYAGGSSPGYFETTPGRYAHYYLHGMPEAEIAEVLPDHVKHALRQEGISKVHGFLKKLD